MAQLRDARIAFGEIEAATEGLLWIIAIGEYDIQAAVRTEELPAGTPRQVRAALLSRAEDAFEGLAAAGLSLLREPDMEFLGRDHPRLVVRFSLVRA